MKFVESKVLGVFVIEMELLEDNRGFFARSWCGKEFEAGGLLSRIAQINVGFTAKRAGLRGLHFQLSPHAESKTVRCTRGSIFDVAVDLRPDSPTHKQWVGFELTAENHRMLYVPEGCAHGYQTLVDDSEVEYLTTQFYAPDSARGFRFDDPAFGIVWPLPVGLISEADKAWPAYPG
jgi:dTDP-4-dehydrorhamnose 3,5-epimerase